MYARKSETPDIGREKDSERKEKVWDQ